MNKPDSEQIRPLVNTGFVFGNEDRNDKAIGCTVILGGARSGTSLLAGTLHHLGVHMGDRATPPVFEDLRLSGALEDRNLDSIRATVRAYSQSHSNWGFKRPGAIDYLKLLEAELPERRYIFVFRDIFATANRNRLSVGLDILKGLDRALDDNRRLVRHVQSTSSAWMLCSYDKILQRPEAFVEAVIAYANLEPSDEQRWKALEFIRPDPVDYIDSSRNTRAMGRLDRLSARVVAGWARYANRDIDAVVDLIVNGEIVDSQKAVGERADVKKAGRHPTGHCGFRFMLSRDLQPGDKVEVRVSDDIRSLNPGPVTFQKARVKPSPSS